MVLLESFNRMSDITIAADQIITDAETTGRSYLATWLEAAGTRCVGLAHARFLDLVASLTTEPLGAKAAIDGILEEFAKEFPGPDAESDLAEDMTTVRRVASSTSCTSSGSPKM
jgi:hypothetical protein